MIYTNPYLGIYLKENSEKKWSVDSFDPLGVGKYYDLKMGMLYNKSTARIRWIIQSSDYGEI
ncbi:hypothetical protein HMPREF9413_1801 [Paenibacillus sp. HGF7]|nr:hypothetical protein HMPREF9413_1801 [Paenibacillus sp. HGF7]